MVVEDMFLDGTRTGLRNSIKTVINCNFSGLSRKERNVYTMQHGLTLLSRLSLQEYTGKNFENRLSIESDISLLTILGFHPRKAWIPNRQVILYIATIATT
jgi:hypothetical protein